MPYIEVTRWIAGERRGLFELVSDMEAYPDFMEDVERVTVLERGEDWTVTDWFTRVDSRTFRWKERDDFDWENTRISYRQIAGDLKKFQGEWILEEVNGGTQVTLTVDFELGIPMLESLLNPILKKKVQGNCESMLDGLKAQCEKGL